MARRLWTFASIAITVAGAAPGCSTWHGEIDPRVAAVEGSAAGPRLRIAAAHDVRVFEAMSWHPWVPTLREGDPADRALTARAIARRRAAPRGQMGNIWLPEGRSAADLAAEAVTAGFRSAGYRVVLPWQPHYEEAAPIDVEVRRFWGRLQPSVSGVRLETMLQLWITAPVPPFQRGALVCAGTIVVSGGPSAAIWRRNFEVGLDELVKQIHQSLAAGTAPAVCIVPGP